LDRGAGLESRFNITITQYQIQVGTSASFDGYDIITRNVDNRTATFLKGNVNWTLHSSSNLQLNLGTRYYVRIKARNGVGFGNWSAALNKILVQPPSAPRIVQFRASGPLVINVTWTTPQDRGAGTMTDYPLLNYHLVLQLSEIEPDLQAATSQTKIVAGDVTSALVSSLQKGVRYFVFVRARNNASAQPDMVGGSYGSWSLGSAACVDGMSRSSVCSGHGIIALELPTIPTDFILRPVGSASVMAQWKLPLDTGDGSRGYPLMRYDIEFADADQFADAEMLSADGSLLQYRTAPGRYEVGKEKLSRLRAVNDAGNSQWSAISSATVLHFPSLPQNLNLINGNLTFLVGFQRPANTGAGTAQYWPLLGYEVEIAKHSLTCPDDPIGQRILKVANGSQLIQNDFTVTKLVKGCDYSIRIRAENEAGFGSYTQPHLAKFLELSSKPTYFVAIPGSALQMILNWDVPMDTGDGSQKNEILILKYQVQISNSTNFDGPLLRTVELTAKTLTLDFLPRVLLYARVFPVTRVGVGHFAHASTTPIIPALTSTSVILSLLVTGETVQATVRMTAATLLVQNQKISIRFPAGFYVSEVQLGAEGTPSGISSKLTIDASLNSPCGTDCRPGPETISLRYIGAEGLQAGTNIMFSLKRVTNRRWAGEAGSFELRLLDAQGTFTIAEALNVSRCFLKPGAISTLTVELDDRRTGRLSTALVKFMVGEHNEWRQDDKALLEFPPSFDLLSTTRVQDLAGAPDSTLNMGSLNIVSFAGNHLILARVGGSVIPTSSKIQFAVTTIKNSIFANMSGPIVIKLLTNQNQVIDEAMFSGIRFVPGNLSNSSVIPLILAAYTTSSVKVCFRCGAVGLPVISKIVVVFPSAHFVNDATFGSVEHMDGTFDFEVQNQVVSVTRTGERTDVPPHSEVCLIFGNVGNYHAALTLPYTITTRSGSGVAMEQELMVVGNMIQPAQLQVEKLELSDNKAGADAQVQIVMAIRGALNFRGTEGGRIIIEFPSGFEMNPDGESPLQLDATVEAPAEGNLRLVGTWSGTSLSLYPVEGLVLPHVPCAAKSWFVCGSGAAIELQGGNEWLSGSKISLSVRGLRTRPFAGETDAFRIYTLNSDNFVSDISDKRTVNLAPNLLHDVSIGPDPLITNQTVSMRFSFLTTNIVPEHCQIHISFPSGYILTEALAVESHFSKLDLSILRVLSGDQGTNVTIVRHAGFVLPRSSNVTFSISGIRTRDKSGATDTFVISVKTADNYTLDQRGNIPGPYLEYNRAYPRGVLPVPNRPSTGNTLVTVSGKGFGMVHHFKPDSQYRTIRFGQTACVNTGWVSDSALTCLLAAGVLPSSIMVTIEKKIATGILLFSYDVPFGRNASRFSNLPVSGASAVLHGGNFGAWAISLAVRAGFSAAERTGWFSDSSVFIRTVYSVGGSLSVVITSGHLPGSLIDFVSYDSSSVSSVAKSNVATGIHTQMYVGHNFGHTSLSPGIRNHGTVCLSTLWMSKSSLHCRVVSGIGSNATGIAVTVARQIGTICGTVTFDSPALVSFLKSPEDSLAAALPEGVRLFNVIGSQFDRVDMSGVMKVGETECTRTTWTSDTTLACQISSFVNDRPLNINYKVSHFEAQLSGAFSTDPPKLSGISRSNGPPSIETHPTVLFGKNFGSQTQSPSGRFGFSACQSTNWVSDTSLSARHIPAIAAAVDIIVSVSRVLGTMTQVLSLDVPVISSTGWANVPATGRSYLTMAGVNLGFMATTHKIRVGFTQCEEQGWSSDTSVSCNVAKGWERSVETVVTVSHSVGGRTKFLSYDSPAWALPSTSNLPTISTHKSSTASLTGSNFGGYSQSMQGRLGLSACSSTTWFAQTSMTCRSVDGARSFNTMVLTIAVQQVSGSLMLSYDAPNPMPLLNGGNLPVAGESKRMQATNLGVSEYSLRYRSGQSACAASLWFSDSSLICRVTAGQGHRLDFVVTLANRKHTSKRMFSYDSCSVSRMVMANSGPSEAAMHTVTGESFSTFSLSQQANIGFSNCAMSEWFSDTVLTLRTANGLSGRGESLVVSVAMERKTTKTALFTYDGPTILDVTGRAESISGDAVTLSGVGFGKHDYTIQAVISTYGCVGTGWIAETTIVCKLNPGFTAGDVTLSAVRDSQFCRKCVPDLELLIGCKKGVGGSAGTCAPCTSCPTGHYRDCAVGGTGTCRQCKNEMEFVDQRTFKDIEGKGLTRCTPCTICGGTNQIGNRYEATRCSIEQDTVCQDCPPCLSGIRVGCSEYFEGTCTPIADGVPGITATHSGRVYSQKLYDSKYLTTEPVILRLTGDNLGTGLTLQANTLIDFPGGIARNISMSAIVPSEAMLNAAKDAELTKGFMPRSWNRRSNQLKVRMKMFTSIIHLSPVGISMVPGANMSFRIDMDTVADRKLVALFRWDQRTSKWQRGNEVLTFGANQVFLNTQNFSSYVLMGLANMSFAIEDDELPQEFLVIIVTCLIILAVIVCLLVYILKRRQRLFKRQSDKMVQLTPHARIMDSPKQENPFLFLPLTPGDTPRTPRTPRTPGALSPATPYRAMGNTERTASWKRHLFSRAPRSTMSPVPRLSLSSLLRGPRDVGSLDSPNVHVPELSGPMSSNSTSEWGLASTRRLLTKTATPQNEFSTRRSASKAPTPHRRDLESNLELLSSAFAPQMRMSDIARKGVKDSLPPVRPPPKPGLRVPQLTSRSQEKDEDFEEPMGFARLVSTSEKARAVLSPGGQSWQPANEIRAVPLPQPTFRRNPPNAKQEPSDTILMVRTDDYGDKSGVGLGRKQVRYSLPSAPSSTSKQRQNAKPAVTTQSTNASAALSPRKIEFKDEMSTPDRLRQFAVRQSPRMTQHAGSMHDDHSPNRHSGPRVQSHESMYSQSFSHTSPQQSSEMQAKQTSAGLRIGASLKLDTARSQATDAKNRLESLPLQHLQALAAGRPGALYEWAAWAPLARSQEDITTRTSTPGSPARAWNHRDHNGQTQRVQQPSAVPSHNTPRVSHVHSSQPSGSGLIRRPQSRAQSPEFSDGYEESGRDYPLDQSPRSPEFSIRCVRLMPMLSCNVLIRRTQDCIGAFPFTSYVKQKLTHRCIST